MLGGELLLGCDAQLEALVLGFPDRPSEDEKARAA
jgi:hypothetical protein